jgi:hypothetical protein
MRETQPCAFFEQGGESLRVGKYLPPAILLKSSAILAGVDE